MTEETKRNKKKWDESEAWFNKEYPDHDDGCLYGKIVVKAAYTAGAEPREKRIAELEAQIENMKCCENCGWYYLQQHWRESKEIDESRMFHCGTCGNKRNWKLREIKEK